MALNYYPTNDFLTYQGNITLFLLFFIIDLVQYFDQVISSNPEL